MKIISYISINILLFFSWHLLLFRKKDSLLFVDRLIGTFVSGLAQIIATEMLLGVVFERLYAAPLFILNAAISTTVICISLFGGRREESKTGANLFIDVFREIKDETLRIFRIIISDLTLLCISCLFVITVLWLLFVGYLFPSYSWDALYYHLPIVGQIMQSGAIQENPTPSFIQQYINIFSKNINLFFLWNVIFLKSDVIVDLSQLFFTIAGVLTVYSMAIKLKIREKYAIYSALLFFFTPVIILQSTTNYVDCAVSMLLLIAVNFLMFDSLEQCADISLPKKTLGRDSAPIVISGLAAGILLGSKPTGPLFFIILLSAIFLRELIRYFKPSNIAGGVNGYHLWDNLKIYPVCFVAPALLIGGYWYLRNWIYYGNPVYYVNVSFFGVTLFTGLKGDWVEPSPEIINNLTYLTRLFYVWMEKVEYYMYDSRLSGFGPVWFIVFLPSLVFALVYSLLKKKSGFLFVVMIIIITFLMHPRNWNTRYVIFIVGAGALSFGLVFDYFQKRENIFRAVALLLAGYSFLTANSPCITPEKVGEFLRLPPAERTLSMHKPFNIDEKARNEYGYWIWIGNNILRGDTLAYTFETEELNTSRPFFTSPLWNSEFSNKVVYVKSDEYQEWLKKLRGTSASYILVRKNSQEDMWIEKERSLYYSLSWMGNIKEKFKIVYADDNYKIARFNEGVEE